MFEEKKNPQFCFSLRKGWEMRVKTISCDRSVLHIPKEKKFRLLDKEKKNFIFTLYCGKLVRSLTPSTTDGSRFLAISTFAKNSLISFTLADSCFSERLKRF